ncbi:MAG: hypothetical protein KC592_20085 [Nitrospira sp.]|nr:hypothetical protein [Nitrospira sp.]
MVRNPDEKIMLAEHYFEIRHAASGSFLDVRGYVADYIRDNKFLPHWRIERNVVHFHDNPETTNKEGAFAGYKSIGYVTFNPETRNFFVDRAGAFWRLLQKNKHYNLPSLERFGARTKVFLPTNEDFEIINEKVFHSLYTETARKVLGKNETDVQFIVESMEEGFDVRVSGGPIHKREAGTLLKFDHSDFEKAGFFVDLDYYQTKSLDHKDIPHLLRKAVDLTWAKVEELAAVIGV